MGATTEEKPGPETYVIFGNSKDKTGYVYKNEVRKFYDDENEWKSDKHGDNEFDHLSQVKVVDTLVVYSSVIELQLTSSGSFQILHTCEVPQGSDVRVTERFSIPHYLNCPQQYFEDITVKLLSLWKTEIPFISGFVRLKLHFKPQERY